MLSTMAENFIEKAKAHLDSGKLSFFRLEQICKDNYGLSCNFFQMNFEHGLIRSILFKDGTRAVFILGKGWESEIETETTETATNDC